MSRSTAYLSQSLDGEFLCLLGPSGCGKSTLLNILAGFEPVTAGTVMSGDEPVTGAGRERVMFFQDAGSALLPWLTVEENVRFGLRVRKVPKAGMAADHRQISAAWSGSTRIAPSFPPNCPAACASACRLRAHSRSSRKCC